MGVLSESVRGVGGGVSHGSHIHSAYGTVGISKWLPSR